MYMATIALGEQPQISDATIRVWRKGRKARGEIDNGLMRTVSIEHDGGQYLLLPAQRRAFAFTGTGEAKAGEKDPLAMLLGGAMSGMIRGAESLAAEMTPLTRTGFEFIGQHRCEVLESRGQVTYGGKPVPYCIRQWRLGVSGHEVPMRTVHRVGDTLVIGRITAIHTGADVAGELFEVPEEYEVQKVSWDSLGAVVVALAAEARLGYAR
jgi:hypothetical protein